MAAVIEIDCQRCKGCGYCVAFCKPKALVMATERNAFGLNYAQVQDAEACNFCLNCARMCPDLAVTVYQSAAKEARHD